MCVEVCIEVFRGSLMLHDGLSDSSRLPCRVF